jgi:hypothetical protein
MRGRILLLAVLACAASAAGAASGGGGCPLFPPENIWNTAIDKAPLDENSAAYVATIGAATHLHPDFGTVYQGAPIGIPYVVVPARQPLVPITFTYANESDPGPYPIPQDPPIEGGALGNGDRHVLIVDAGECKLYEIYNARRQIDGSWRGGSGAVWSLESNALRPPTWTSADAAGLPILAGLVLYDEVRSGEITHALRFTAPQTRNAFVWPARHQASDLTGSEYPPMGQRFRLKANFGIASFPANVQVILRALKKYGMMLADNGSAWYLSGAPDSRWDDDELHTLTQIPGDAFEAVDVTALRISASSGQAMQPPLPPALPAPPAGATYDIDGDGAYDPLTDGVLIARWLKGVRGDALVAGAVAVGAARNAAQIESHLGTLGAALVVDGNHVADAQTDGVVILRRLFGATGQPLVRASIAAGAQRTSPDAVTSYLNGFMPAAP